MGASGRTCRNACTGKLNIDLSGTFGRQRDRTVELGVYNTDPLEMPLSMMTNTYALYDLTEADTSAITFHPRIEPVTFLIHVRCSLRLSYWEIVRARGRL